MLYLRNISFILKITVDIALITCYYIDSKKTSTFLTTNFSRGGDSNGLIRFRGLAAGNRISRSPDVVWLAARNGCKTEHLRSKHWQKDLSCSCDSSVWKDYAVVQRGIGVVGKIKYSTFRWSTDGLADFNRRFFQSEQWTVDKLSSEFGLTVNWQYRCLQQPARMFRLPAGKSYGFATSLVFMDS